MQGHAYDELESRARYISENLIDSVNPLKVLLYVTHAAVC
jgi:hypothetical protein